MNSPKNTVHIVHNYLLQPTNPVLVNVIGAGGTGSHVIHALVKTDYSLRELGHPGLHVQVIDHDTITGANKGRQLFYDAEIGMYKADALINRINRNLGTNWKAITCAFNRRNLHRIPGNGAANITISCVDAVPPRFEIAAILRQLSEDAKPRRDKPLYWMDFGNSRYTGQVILSTIGSIQQPASEKFDTVANLPFITEQYKALLQQSTQDDTPSCSLADALLKQDLFINPSLASLGGSLLWTMFREAILPYRGFFLDVKNFRATPIPVNQ